ncbi:hypothetical protein DFH06DRAFT_1150102 [Mycena polygramma]|nr:hypothetical protein DFH06DRAFT_1150102 [Mycena polygramma]
MAQAVAPETAGDRHRIYIARREAAQYVNQEDKKRHEGLRRRKDTSYECVIQFTVSALGNLRPLFLPALISNAARTSLRYSCLTHSTHPHSFVNPSLRQVLDVFLGTQSKQSIPAAGQECGGFILELEREHNEEVTVYSDFPAPGLLLLFKTTTKAPPPRLDSLAYSLFILVALGATVHAIWLAYHPPLLFIRSSGRQHLLKRTMLIFSGPTMPTIVTQGKFDPMSGGWISHGDIPHAPNNSSQGALAVHLLLTQEFVPGYSDSLTTDADPTAHGARLKPSSYSQTPPAPTARNEAKAICLVLKMRHSSYGRSTFERKRLSKTYNPNPSRTGTLLKIEPAMVENPGQMRAVRRRVVQDTAWSGMLEEDEIL